MVSTYTPPDFTSQTATAYKTALDDAAAVHHRLAGAFAPHAQASPDMTVRVDAGHLFAGATLTEVAAQSTGTITAPVGNPRIDRVVIDRTTGAVAVITGTPAASPAAPALPAGKLPVAQVLLQTNSTTISNDMITDERVTSGTGGGPSSSTSHALALFSDSNGTLKDGPALGAAGQVLTSNGSGADPSFQTLIDTWAHNNLLLMGLRLEINSAITTGAMVDGEVWGFLTDELATKTNASYEGTGDYYSCEGSSGAIAQGTGTAFGDMTAGAGLAAAFDGTTSQAAGSGATAYATVGYIGKDWGSGNSKTVSGVTFYCSNNLGLTQSGADTFTFKVYGSNSAPANSTDGTLLYTSGTITDSASIVSQLSGFTTSTAYRYHWVRFDTTTSSAEQYLSELTFYETNPATDITLIPNAVTAVAVPTDVRVMILHKDVSGSYSLNTDLTNEVSRDGGTTWTAITLADGGVYDAGAGWRILAGTVDVSAQPSGTSIKWRIKTFNTKGQRVKGVAMMWS